jgi:hypothetical protein
MWLTGLPVSLAGETSQGLPEFPIVAEYGLRALGESRQDKANYP